MAKMSILTSHADDVKTAQQRADTIGRKIVSEYAQPSGMYAFSRNADGSVDKTATFYPSIAWWGGAYALPNADAMFSRWASDEFSTDWGTRDVGEHEAVSDPISYHQGSVWPLFTGWVSVRRIQNGAALWPATST